MIPVEYKNLCPVCKENISAEELEKEICQKENKPFLSVFLEERETFFRKIFSQITGEPRSIQNLWIKRIVKNESFTAIAPTGLGKTTFGLITSLFFSLERKKTYILVPTTFLVKQCHKNLEQFYKKLENLNNSLKETVIISYSAQMKKEEKEKFKEKLEKDNFDILITTTQFLAKNFPQIKEKKFDFIFVDDVDAILKTSKNVEKVITLLGFKKIKNNWEIPQKKGILVVSTATAKKGKSSLLFRKLLNFDVGLSFFSLRNIEDIAILSSDYIEEVKKILKKMGKGGIIYAESISQAENIYESLKDEFKIGIVTSKKTKHYELFSQGEFDYLVGTAFHYGALIRGLDLPYKIRFTIFCGAPVFRIKWENVSSKILKILTLILKDNPQVKKFLPLLSNIEKYPEKLEELKNILKKIELVEDIIVRKKEIIFPDIKVYLQGSGRSSRLTNHGLTKGASFLIEKDKDIIKAFIKKAQYYDLAFKSQQTVDFSLLNKEIDDSRKKEGEKDLITTALFVVESPTKAKQIAHFFGKPSVKLVDPLLIYEVMSEKYLLLITACLGHLLDLVTDEALWGVRVENHKFIPIYTSLKKCRSCLYQFTTESSTCPWCGKEDIDDTKGRIEALRKIAYQVDLAIVGTDPDAEGEKIAWDIANLLRGITKIKRAEFHEVTPWAIKEALNNLRTINENLVKAQIVRRIEDRWIGFELSQRLQKVFKNKNISAGRVQTPVLFWIVEQEKKFRQKKKIAYNKELDLTFENINKKRIKIKIELIEKKREKKAPLPPYSTDELLRDAYRILKFSASTCMKLAQELFEKGLITYHRTDSFSVSKMGQKIAQEYLKEDFSPRDWSKKEGAHECIRPTKAWDRFTLQRMIYENIISLEGIKREHFALYDLIFKRFMASQAKEIEIETEVYRIKYEDKEKIEERIIKAEGKAFQLYRNLKIKKPLPQGEKEISLKIFFVPQENLYTQADVIRKMKEKGIGRPSTYSAIIEKLFLRKYIEERKAKIFPTFLGKKVLNFIHKNWFYLVNEERTKNLMEKMDKIEKGMIEYNLPLEEIYQELKNL